MALEITPVSMVLNIYFPSEIPLYDFFFLFLSANLLLPETARQNRAVLMHAWPSQKVSRISKLIIRFLYCFPPALPPDAAPQYRLPLISFRHLLPWQCWPREYQNPDPRS